MADTGLGATLAATTQGSVARVRRLTLPEWMREKLDKSVLATTGFIEYHPGDLDDPGEVVAEIVFDATADDFTTVENGEVDTFTVTFPIHTSGNTTAATLAGTGFATGQKLPDLAINELQVATLTIAYDGGTGPTFTGES